MTRFARSFDATARVVCAFGLLGMAVLVVLGLAELRRGDDGPVVANPPLPVATYLVGDGPMRSELRLEVASTPEQRRRGLMARDGIGAADGMAFVYDGSPETFWMRGTRFPLDIAYVAPSGRVSSVRRGKAFDETLLPSDGPVGLVVEVPAGRARLYGLRPGASVKRMGASR